MIGRLLKRRLCPPIPDKSYALVGGYVVLLLAALILVAGFRVMSELDLTNAQLALGSAIIFSMCLQCGILVVLLEVLRKLAAKVDQAR